MSHESVRIKINILINTRKHEVGEKGGGVSVFEPCNVSCKRVFMYLKVQNSSRSKGQEVKVKVTL